MRVLIAVVAPSISTPIADGSRPLLRMQSMTPWTSWAGVVRLFAWANRPLRAWQYDTTMGKATTKRRCPWCLGSERYLRYHDEEWGVPVHDDRRLFEFLILEGAQAGLSWSTILNKQDNYRRAFARFDPAKVARFGVRDVERLMADAGIVRN